MHPSIGRKCKILTFVKITKQFNYFRNSSKHINFNLIVKSKGISSSCLVQGYISENYIT